uniref:Cinnamoyl-CoA reductase n=1 Tax=Steinernema glaseri TaxID=37863 RepID=A0A1I8AHZ0_9BILA
MPAVPQLQLALVDVRDVAKAHVASMLSKEADGHRILVTAQPSFWFKDIARVLAKEFYRQGYSLPRFTVPYPLVWLYSFVDSQTKAILQRIGFEVKFDNSKAKKLLGLSFTDPAHSLVEMAYSMVERGIVPKKAGYRGPPSEKATSS